MTLDKKIDRLLRNVPDFPKPGIMFKDITPVLQHAETFKAIIDDFKNRTIPNRVDYIAGIESRGFIFGAALAHALGCGFLTLRKPGKLPWKTVRATYQLEYGSDAIEMHEDSVNKGDRVIVFDDLLATGGTATAASHLLRDAGADIIANYFVVELADLKGREKLEVAGFRKIEALLKY